MGTGLVSDTGGEVIRIDYRKFIEDNFFILDKDSQTPVPFRFNVVQDKYYKILQGQHDSDMEGVREMILKARQQGMCLHPDTQVLTTDFRWISIKDITIGENLFAVEEYGKKGSERKLVPSKVEGKKEVFKKAFKITFCDGRIVIATAGHRFLGKRSRKSEIKWLRVNEMKIGSKVRYITSAPQKNTLNDYWFSGILDGEGTLRKKRRAGAELSVCQVKGPVWDKMIDYAKRSGLHYRVEWDKRRQGFSSKLGSKNVGRIVFSRMNEIIELMTKTRPVRFLEKEWWQGKSLPGKKTGKAWVDVLSIEEMESQSMIDLQTSEKTFIADGLVSHNSSFVLALFTADFILRPYSVSICISHRKDATDILFKKVKFYLESYFAKLAKTSGMNPADVERQFLKTDNKGQLENAQNHATFYIGTAGARVGGRGGSARNILFSECISASQKVIGKDGFVFPITQIPEQIRDGNGALIKPVGLRKVKPKEGMKRIKVYGNFPFPIEATLGHKLWTRTGTRYNYTEGWKKVKDITSNDYLGFPITLIEKTPRNKNPFSFPLSKDFGEFCGWYLAEGSMGKNRVDLAIHTNEKEYIKGLLDRLGIKHSFYARGNGTAVHICNVKFRQEILSFFGEKQGKMIPDRVWGFGKEFIRGLLRGIFLGDGRCKGQFHQLSLASIRPQLIVQLKRLIISLRLAYPGIQVQKANTQKNRNNKETWTITITGKGYTNVTNFIGIERTQRVDGRRKGYNKFFHFGSEYFWAKVHSVKDMPLEEYVYDVILDREPHSFCILASKSHNCAFYQDTELITAQEIVIGTAQQVPQGIGMIFIESCVAGDTLVFTEGGILPIKRYMYPKLGFSYGKKVNVFGRYGMQQTGEFYNNGEAETKKITTKKGYKLEGTYIHPILVLENGKLIRKEMKDVKTGDLACLQFNQQAWGLDDSIAFSENPRGNSANLPIELTPDISYFLGLFLAEGYARKQKRSGQVIITTGDEEIGRQLPKLINVKWKKIDKHHYIVSNTSLYNFLKEFGFSLDKKAPGKKFPVRILRASKENVSAFLSGMFDGDGCSRQDSGYITYTSTSRHIIQTLQVVLLNYGIISKVYQKEPRLGGVIGKRQIKKGNIAYQLEINGQNAKVFYSQIGFRLARKQKNTQKLKSVNQDIVVHGISSLIRKCLKKKGLKLTSTLKKYNISNSAFYSRHGGITKNTLNKVLQAVDNKTLREFAKTDIFTDKVERIENSQAITYDFHIPEKHSFVSNGFLSFNTANGMGNYYQREWDRSSEPPDRKGNRPSVYTPRFFGWHEFYTKEWVDKKKKEFPNEEMWKQEYPKTAEDAFISSGMPFFNLKVLKEMKDEKASPLYKGRFLSDGSLEIIDAEEPPVRIYRDLQIGEQCVVFADPADSQDYCAATVCSKKRYDFPVVMNEVMESSQFGYELYSMCKYVFNKTNMWPKLAVERNTGQATIFVLKNLNYPDLFRMVDFSSQSVPYEKGQIGWTTTGHISGGELRGTRRKMLDDFALALRQGILLLYDQTQIKQLMDFVIIKGRAQAQSSKYDDLVMATAGCWQIQELTPSVDLDDFDIEEFRKEQDKWRFR